MTGEDILNNYIQECAKKEEELILNVFKKQKDFISVEESKSFIQVNRMIRSGEHVGTDYLFKGKRILTVYPQKFKEENGKYTFSFNYQEYE